MSQLPAPRLQMSPEKEAEVVAKLKEITDGWPEIQHDVLVFRLGRRDVIRVSASGKFDAKKIGHLIRLLEVQRDLLAEDDGPVAEEGTPV